jgi:NitT/TauT family transport system substrate-binding protein
MSRRREKGAGPFWSTAAAITIAALIASPSAQKAPMSITFLTNYAFMGRHAPFFLGRDKGFYRDAGFDVNIVPATGSGFVISAVESGKGDYGIAESASVIQAVARGARIKGFSVFMDVSTSGLASLKPCAAPQDVVGKTVAASLTDSARVILPVVFTRAGLDRNGIKWVTSDPIVYFSLLLGGRADLVTASSDGDLPALLRVAQPRGQTVHFASFAEWGYTVFGYFLVARADRIGGRADEVRAFAAATARAVRYAVEHPEEAAKRVAAANPALPEATALAQWRESMKAIETPFVKQNGYGQATDERLRQTIALVGDALSLNPRPEPRDIYADLFVKGDRSRFGLFSGDPVQPSICDQPTKKVLTSASTDASPRPSARSRR